MSSHDDSTFEQEAFFEVSTSMLSEAGILDNVSYAQFISTTRGMRIDGYSWNELEKTLSGIIVHYDGDDEVTTLTKTEITKLSNRVEKFMSRLGDQSFLDTLEESTDRVVADDMAHYLGQAIKYRVVIISDSVLSTLVKKIEIETIAGIPAVAEVWDLNRLRILDSAGSENEPFTADFETICGGLDALPANVNQDGASSYLCVMPGSVLSKLYDEYGQRLLEANVRTFLDFRSSVNNGIRRGLLTEPENFFSYNNGLTCTGTAIATENHHGNIKIKSIDNLQIVNGGQTTASIYFSPREKGGISGHNYRDIDLSKVYVQMKLTIISDESIQDVLKSKISQFANTQNSIQKSDLVSNHPFHLNLEKLALSVPMPAGKTGFTTKWFYERARGQYGTKLRALTGAAKRTFELEYPKEQKFSKPEMAKYENTWRMKPYEVKKGNEANLKLLGEVIVEEYEKNESAFKHSWYKDLVSKIILFRRSDEAIGKSNWYKEDRGLKAETVTYTIAYLRHSLLEQGLDINLTRIFNNQCLSESLKNVIVDLAREIRAKIMDPVFRDGVSNPSEFCKSKRGWERVSSIKFSLENLDARDVLDMSQKSEENHEKEELDKAGAQLEVQTGIMDVSAKEWDEIAAFFAEQGYPSSHINVSLPRKCALIYKGGSFPSDKQSVMAMNIRKEAYSGGFDIIL